ncbi:MAG: FAD-dependent oxidoreductase [Pseudomonadota bacterium]|nr:FAD-dependent oxidoreductase [Pseudomonadota bacterium]
MTDTADAIIIGAGVIGAGTAFELAKLGYKTLSVDRNAEAGHGPTSSSCAVIRLRYSTLDGTAFASKATSTGASRRNILALRTSAGLRLFETSAVLSQRRKPTAIWPTTLRTATRSTFPMRIGQRQESRSAY